MKKNPAHPRFPSKASADALAQPVERLQWLALGVVFFLLVLILKWHLLVALLSALATFSIHQALLLHLGRRMSLRWAHLCALVVVLVFTASLGLFVYIGLSELHEAYRSGRLLSLTESVLGTIQHFDAWLPDWLLGKAPQTPAEAQALFLQWSDAHPEGIKSMGQFAGRSAAHVLMGLIIGFLAGAAPLESTLHGSVFMRAWCGRLRQLCAAFTSVVSAQLRISVVNTVLTALFLLVLLPLWGYKMPLALALVVVTFVAGLLPIVGNLVSNTAITLIALTISPWLATACLIFLIAVHKLEYFINAKIMGHRLQLRTYELLAVMLFMEAGFGLAGLVAAPVYYAWLRRELKNYHLV